MGIVQTDIGRGRTACVTGGLGYNINKTFAAYLGYRYLAYEHSLGGLTVDSHQHGPLIALGIRFQG